jgi:hypothetical protein
MLSSNLTLTTRKYADVVGGDTSHQACLEEGEQRLARCLSLFTALFLFARVGAASAQSGSELVDRVKNSR